MLVPKAILAIYRMALGGQEEDVKRRVLIKRDEKRRATLSATDGRSGMVVKFAELAGENWPVGNHARDAVDGFSVQILSDDLRRIAALVPKEVEDLPACSCALIEEPSAGERVYLRATDTERLESADVKNYDEGAGIFPDLEPVVMIPAAESLTRVAINIAQLRDTLRTLEQVTGLGSCVLHVPRDPSDGVFLTAVEKDVVAAAALVCPVRDDAFPWELHEIPFANVPTPDFDVERAPGPLLSEEYEEDDRELARNDSTTRVTLSGPDGEEFFSGTVEEFRDVPEQVASQVLGRAKRRGRGRNA